MHFNKKGSDSLLKEFRDLFEKIRKKGGILKPENKFFHDHFRCALDIKIVDEKTIRLTCYGTGKAVQVVEVSCDDRDKLRLILDIVKAKQIRLEKPIKPSEKTPAASF
jgi:hypothetical protein